VRHVTRDRKTQFVTVAVLLAAVSVGVVRKTAPRRPEPTPQDAIYSMLDAARTGDVRKYLAHYAGPMEAALRQTLAETTEPGFAKYLKDSNAAIKGVAVSDPEKIGDREAKVRVEYIYQDRNEAQTMYLEKVPDGWKISRAEAGDRVKTLIPYGTPVR
jgi:hypothetical protein